MVFFIQNNSKGGFGPFSFGMIVNNKIHDCRQGIAVQFSSSEINYGNKDATFLGNVFRRNEV